MLSRHCKWTDTCLAAEIDVAYCQACGILINEPDWPLHTAKDVPPPRAISAPLEATITNRLKEKQ
jgi:hypothetical protein